MPRVDFYFDFISPYSYLAATRIDELERQSNTIVRWLPMNLPRLIKLSGNVPPASIPNKARYLMRDLKRWADYLEVPFKLILPGSFDSRPALNIASELPEEERKLFSTAIFDEIWSGRVSTKQENWLEQVFMAKKLPLDWLDLSLGIETDTLRQNTEDALKAGAFGAPTFLVHSQSKPLMFFGVDRMDFLARALEHANE